MNVQPYAMAEPSHLAPPSVRVVVPAFRATKTIREVVGAILQSQNCGTLQVVVVDDGANGDLAETLRGLPVDILSEGPGGSAAAARNRGALGFAGKFLVFVDADVVVDQFCIARLLDPLQGNMAEATVGNYSKEVSGATFASRYKQLYISRIYERTSGYIQNDFWSAAGAVDAAVFHGLGGFDTQFRGACGEDVELGGRLTRAGFRILGVPEATGKHRNVLSLPQLLRNDWRKGVMAMRTCLDSAASVVDNRHSTSRDIQAVALAAAAMLMPFLALRSRWRAPALAMLAALLIAYLITRLDLLRSFTTQGMSFTVAAAPLMFFLDLLRAACVGFACWLHFVRHRRLLGRVESEQPSLSSR